MIFSPLTRNTLFHSFAVVCAGAAFYHLLAVFYPLNNIPLWRNGLFVAIDLAFAYAALKRPWYLVYLVVVLFVQQCYTHGLYIIRLWNEKNQIHWISVVELALFPLAILLTLDELKMNRKSISK